MDRKGLAVIERRHDSRLPRSVDGAPRLGIEADPEGHDDERHEGQHFARSQVVQLFVLGIGYGSKWRQTDKPAC